MNLSILSKKILEFTLNRVIDIIGILVIIVSIFLLLSLISYSPDDPNFIFPENTNINNLFGFYGSYTSDIFFQSFGLISFLFSISIFFNGISIIRNKNFSNLLRNFFYSIIYIAFGSAFLSIFYPNSYWLIINGNGGFVGNYINDLVLETTQLTNQNIIYTILLIFSFGFFFLSLNINIKTVINFFKILFKKIFTKKVIVENFDNLDEKYQNTILQENNKEIKQADLPFQQNQKNKNKFILPSIGLLKLPPAKNNKFENNLNKNSDPEFLEKVLLDFGVEGKIKKISNGPVVTLNEFEPAPGIKVAKIINLSEDIARNTSSESARIATIPGKNTVGIEIPNLKRENVFLSEIISDEKFYKKEIKLPIALGKSISGIPIIGDLSSMPHLLIAGTTGSGKSVCINTIILSLLYKLSPEQCKFIMIDPKMLELSTYEGIPHLICPVITEAKKAASILGWVVKEMESRYKLNVRLNACCGKRN